MSTGLWLGTLRGNCSFHSSPPHPPSELPASSTKHPHSLPQWGRFSLFHPSRISFQNSGFMQNSECGGGECPPILPLLHLFIFNPKNKCLNPSSSSLGVWAYPRKELWLHCLICTVFSRSAFFEIGSGHESISLVSCQLDHTLKTCFYILFNIFSWVVVGGISLSIWSILLLGRESTIEILSFLVPQRVTFGRH